MYEFLIVDRDTTENRAMLTDIVEKADSVIIFRDNDKWYTKKKIDNVVIKNISFIQCLKHDLLRISQFTDKWFIVKFIRDMCLISTKKMGSLLLKDCENVRIYGPYNWRKS